MHLVLVGLSHKTAPISIRERVAFSPQDQERALLRLRQCEDVEECLLLSTCNRTEILAVFRNGRVSPEFLLNFLAERKSIPPEEISSYSCMRSTDQNRNVLHCNTGFDLFPVSSRRKSCERGHDR
ncbi:MAG: hypothetical protein ABIH23_13960, partial [bacterium]